MTTPDDITILKELDDWDEGGGRHSRTRLDPTPDPLPVTHRGILDAIRKEPDELVHRMALVDWLTDEGEFEEPWYHDLTDVDDGGPQTVEDVARTGVLRASVGVLMTDGPRLCTRYGVVRVELVGSDPLKRRCVDTDGDVYTWVMMKHGREADVGGSSRLPLEWFYSEEKIEQWTDGDRQPSVWTDYKTAEAAMADACERALAWCLANTPEARADRVRQRVAEQVAKAMAERAERRAREAIKAGRG